MPPREMRGTIYAADAEPDSLSISRQVAATLGANFQAESSRNVTASVDRLTEPSPDLARAVLPATTVAFLEKSNEKVRQSICYITRIGVLDIHVITAPQIRRLSELAGLNVDLGPNGSQNQITASLLLESASLQVEPLYDDHDRALGAIMRGQIAAMILLTKKPSSVLFAAQGVHFLPVTIAMPGCILDQILPGDYPLLGGESGRGGPVDTLAVPLVLASYAWPTGSKEFLSTVRVADLLLKRQGNEISVNVEGWQRFEPVAEWLGRGSRGSIIDFARSETAPRIRSE